MGPGQIYTQPPSVEPESLAFLFESDTPDLPASRPARTGQIGPVNPNQGQDLKPRPSGYEADSAVFEVF